MKYSLSLCLAVGLGLTVACSNKDASHRHSHAKAQAQETAEASEKSSVTTKTADSQMLGSNSDVDVTRKIRDRLTDMDELSIRAQNITIVTRENNITLIGTVDKQEEI